MINTRTVAAAAAGAIGAGVLGAGLFTLPASAQTTLGPWSVAPGDSFPVSGGAPCVSDDPEAEMTVTISINDPAVTPDVTGVPVNGDGSWSTSVTVSESEAPGAYGVGARCLADGVPIADPSVGEGDLTVVDEGTTTTESSTTSTTSGEEPPTPTTAPDDGDGEGPDDEGPDGGDDGDGEGPPSEDGDDEDEGPQPGDPAPPVNGDADYTG